jgi:hypothetical protein
MGPDYRAKVQEAGESVKDRNGRDSGKVFAAQNAKF